MYMLLEGYSTHSKSLRDDIFIMKSFLSLEKLSMLLSF